MKKIIEIEGMNCSHCTQKVENALYGLPETEEVNINLENKCSEVDFSSDVDDKLISDLIKSVGFTPTTVENV